MEIVLCDIRRKMCDEWGMLFNRFDDVKVICGDYCSAAREYEVDGLTSPGNSFGIMDGGLDYYIKDFYKMNGVDIQSLTQEKIRTLYGGIQPVGSSLFVKNDVINLIHSPTMKIPKVMLDFDVIYFATRESILCGLKNNLKRIMLPAFGGGVGRVEEYVVARVMFDGFYSLNFQNFKDWNEVYKLADKEINDFYNS